MFKKPDEKQPLFGDPTERVFIGLFLFFCGGMIVLANFQPIGGDSGILNPFVWGAVSLYGIMLMVWGVLERRGDK